MNLRLKLLAVFAALGLIAAMVVGIGIGPAGADTPTGTLNAVGDCTQPHTDNSYTAINVTITASGLAPNSSYWINAGQNSANLDAVTVYTVFTVQSDAQGNLHATVNSLNQQNYSALPPGSFPWLAGLYGWGGGSGIGNYQWEAIDLGDQNGPYNIPSAPFGVAAGPCSGATGTLTAVGDCSQPHTDTAYTAIDVTITASGLAPNSTYWISVGDEARYHSYLSYTVLTDAQGNFQLTETGQTYFSSNPTTPSWLVGSYGWDGPGSYVWTTSDTNLTDPSIGWLPFTVSASQCGPPPPQHLNWVNDDAALHEPCAQNGVLVVALRGSGQSDGAGNELRTFAHQIDANLPQSIPVRLVYIDYTSASVWSIITPGQGPGYYLASIGDGEQRLRNVLNDSASRCPSEKWVIGGYSQGALVAHLVAAEYANTNQLASVDMLADPARSNQPAQDGNELGTAGIHDGIYTLTHGQRPLPASWTGKMNSLCDSRDVVCDIGSAYYSVGLRTALGTPGPARILAAPVFAAQIRDGINVHTSYGADQLIAMGNIASAQARHALNGG
jgi:hypothetical protein